MIRAHIMSWGYQKAPMNTSNCSPAQVMLKVSQYGLQVLLLLNAFLWLGNFYQRKLLSALPPEQHHKAEDSFLLFLQSTCYILVSRSSLCVYGYIYIKKWMFPIAFCKRKINNSNYLNFLLNCTCRHRSLFKYHINKMYYSSTDNIYP